MHAFICMLMCIHVCMYYVYFCNLYVCVCVYVCVYMYVLVCLCMHAYMYIYKYIYIYIFFPHSLSCPPRILDNSNRRRNVWFPQASIYPIANIGTEKCKMYIYNAINKSPFSTKSMQIFIPQIQNQFYQNIHLPIQQKHDTQPLGS